MMKKSLSKKTKAELELELDEIKSELKQHQQTATQKTLDLEKATYHELKENTKNLSIETIYDRIEVLRKDFSTTLTKLAEELTAEVKVLDSVTQAIEAEKKELEKLHHMDLAAVTLDQLVLEYENEKKQLDEESTALRLKWDEEKKFQIKERAREKEEYEYQLATQRKKQQDEFEVQWKERERTHQEKQKQLEVQWKMREENLLKQETEYVQLKKEVDSFPKRLETSIKAAVDEVTNRLNITYKQEQALASKDHEATKRLLEQQVKNLESIVEKQHEQLQILHQEVKSSKQQVQDIALRAIEGRAEAKALAHVNQIAMEQAKQPAGKA